VSCDSPSIPQREVTAAIAGAGDIAVRRFLEFFAATSTKSNGLRFDDELFSRRASHHSNAMMKTRKSAP
jgi:hypothetical protein